ncbi:ATP-binding cassette sub-family G member 1-like [Haematobia irritans]|uniref:ATP-binding cassette sub-family G member 1-like n=1 Tax=Haematobia irritans TaxID=7368 RepID=UPI003F5032AA
MAESIQLQNTTPLSSLGQTPIKPVDNEDGDVITLNILNTMEQQHHHHHEAIATSSSNATLPPSNSLTTGAAAALRPTTPSRFSKRLFSRKPEGLHLNISKKKLEETSCTTTPMLNATPPYGDDPRTPPNTTSTIFPYEENRMVKQINIGFENIRYSKRLGFFRRETKDILHGITGFFKAGELSAIVGPSGAGKSTCLNILSGYTTFGYSGDVTVNDELRDIKAFKQNVAFITQDTSLQPYLTVKEAMHFSANLKIGAHMSKNAKRERVKKILEAIGMYENRHTRTGKLSGGQKKRLSIALELVNNPPVLILDEPTSGLDSSTSNQCISLLKKLALEGRTVICTIHQPSALTFEMFDHLYAIAGGSCIYSGGTQNLVPFLADVGLECPESYNPADYLMEIATDDYGPQNDKLIDRIENGRNNSYRQTKAARAKQLEAMQKIDKMMASGLITPVTAPVLSTPMTQTNNSNGQYVNGPTSASAHPYHYHQHHQTTNYISHHKPLTPIKEMASRIGDSHGILSDNTNAKEDGVSTAENGCCPSHTQSKGLCKSENIYATPFYRQLGILLLRTFLILWRDKSLTLMRFIIHLVTALLIGFLYYGIGNEAENALNNFRYCFYSIMFIMYSAFSSILVKCKYFAELKNYFNLRLKIILTRDHEVFTRLYCNHAIVFNNFLLLARLASHVVIGIIFGYLYIDVGNKANTVLGNYVYLYGSTLLLVYTGKMAVVLTFPLEIGMLSREHFNRWYNLGPYFLSLLSFEVPFQCICTSLYLGISIWLTDNEQSDNFRVMYFMLFGILVTLSAQAWGFFVGATLPTKLAVFLGPILAVLFSVFGFCTRYIDITPVFRWMWHISYFRAGFHGAVNAVYGMDRSALPCPENIIYCHFRNPKVFLEFIMITDVSVLDCVLLMVGVICVMHLLTVITLWRKLNKR